MKIDSISLFLLTSAESILINIVHSFYSVSVSQSVLYFAADGPSLLGLSHISNVSMNVNETAMTTATVSRIETADPIDSFDVTICPTDDLLDGCKVNLVLCNSPRTFIF